MGGPVVSVAREMGFRGTGGGGGGGGGGGHKVVVLGEMT